MTNKRVLSLDYLIGLFETDGCFSLTFRKGKGMTLGYVVYPVIVFTQKSHDLLECICLTLLSHKIPYTFENNEHKKRGSNVKIAGMQNTRQFLKIVLKDKPLSLFGLKHLDFLKMQAIFRIIDANEHNTPLGRAKIIDIKYSLHSHTIDNQSDELPLSRAKLFPRSVWEKRHKLEVDSSKGSAKLEIMEAHKRYEQYKQVIKAKSATELKALIPPEYLSGLIEGDGCITLGCLQRKGITYPRFTASFKIVIEDGGESLLQVVATYLNDDRPYIARDRVKASWYYHTSRLPILTVISEHLARYPVYFKQQQAECLAEVLSVWEKSRLPLTHSSNALAARESSLEEQESGTALSIEEVHCLIRRIYACGTSAQRRKKNLEPVLKEVSIWFERKTSKR